MLPAVRRADPDAMIMTSGFSCRQQIEQLTDRRALHLAQVLQRGLQNREPAARTDASPARVRGLSSSGRSSPGGRLRRLALAAAGVAAGGLLAVHLGGRKSE